MYDHEVAEVYDEVYRGRGRDFASEAEEVHRLVTERCPQASSLLDVACGTGAHLRSFADIFKHVEGVELSAGMLGVARSGLPGVPVHQGDMRDFSLDRRFSVVTCMFSSIGHTRTTAELRAALSRFARHLEPGGVIVVEPWWFPDTFLDGYVTGDVINGNRRTVARLSHSRREGKGSSRVTVHFAVTDPEAGLHHVTEEYPVSLFEQADYEEAFRAAGCPADYITGGPHGRGWFVACAPTA
ncbi:dTDP-3-amino-3,4,6-trideoxy-alpha-D-glucopyranose [Streptomyces sp. YIM 130001]|uniref:class I SAM-dependent methyltransferase n=1 Tax=Streptomyces sp. YIM 130001 TaxID=2259644 RepID=UPI000E64D841|nr:class I SAM-dependent methyltransferase [Streptomyces sp. YIM 130001]RII07929.1 dTDP-3-amino-3,4,6-trideoxy-alpha-D-glucopyranose [Streptomyces sp. YIM 130001]